MWIFLNFLEIEIVWFILKCYPILGMGSVKMWFRGVCQGSKFFFFFDNRQFKFISYFFETVKCWFDWVVSFNNILIWIIDHFLLFLDFYVVFHHTLDVFLFLGILNMRIKHFLLMIKHVLWLFIGNLLLLGYLKFIQLLGLLLRKWWFINFNNFNFGHICGFDWEKVKLLSAYIFGFVHQWIQAFILNALKYPFLFIWEFKGLLFLLWGLTEIVRWWLCLILINKSITVYRL